ncbi:MAG: hypothetical protein V1804_00775 [Patescibacteria group bacterium]
MKEEKRLLVWGQQKTKRRIFLSLVFFASSLLILSFYTGNFSLSQVVHAQYQAEDLNASGNVDWSNSAYSSNPTGGGGAASTKAENPGAIASGFLWVFDKLLYVVFKFVAYLVSLAAILFDIAVNPEIYKALMSMQAVKNAWVMIRDTLNLFFIMILLFSAFCTIFQIEKYHIKKIFLHLVLMAALVNFSFPLALLIADAGNLAMYYYFGALSSGGSISQVIVGSSSGGQMGSGNITGIQAFILPDGSNSGTFQLLAAIVFIFIFGITLLVIAVLLIIRLVVLMLLVIFSPIGFVGSIFPGFSKYSSDWWTAMFKQSFFGAIMAWGMYVAVMIMREMQMQSGVTATIAKYAETQDSGALGKVIVGGATLAIPIILLWAVIIAAQKMGAIGAKEVGGLATKVAKWPTKMMGKGAKWGIKAGARKFDRDILAPHGLSPRAFVAGWKARAQDAEDKALKPAAGAWRDRLNRVFSLGKEKSHYKDMEEENLVNKELHEMESYATNDDYLISEIRNSEGKKDGRSQARVAAAVRMLFRSNDQNEFMKKFGVDGDGTPGSGNNRDPIATREALAKVFESTGMNKNQVGRNLFELGEIGLARGNYGDYGMGTFDKKTNGYRVSGIAKDEKTGIEYNEQIAASSAKFVNLSSQEKMRSIHWNSILTETKEGETGGVHNIGKALLNSITASEVKQVNRSRSDFLKRMSDKEGRKSLLAFIDSKECTNKENVQDLLNEIDRLNAKKTEEETGEKESGRLIAGNLNEEFNKARSDKNKK